MNFPIIEYNCRKNFSPRFGSEFWWRQFADWRRITRERFPATTENLSPKKLFLAFSVSFTPVLGVTTLSGAM